MHCGTSDTGRLLSLWNARFCGSSAVLGSVFVDQNFLEVYSEIIPALCLVYTTVLCSRFIVDLSMFLYSVSIAYLRTCTSSSYSHW